MAGVNHNCWSTTHLYDGEDIMPLLEQGWEKVRDDPTSTSGTAGCCTWPWRCSRSRPTTSSTTTSARSTSARRRRTRLTRAGVILSHVDDYWAHYREQAASERPAARPGPLARRHPRARAGDRRDERLLQRRARPAARSTCATPAARCPASTRTPWSRCGATSTAPAPTRSRRSRSRTPSAGITQQLAEYQRLAAVAAWDGSRADAVRALVAHPFVPTLAVAEELYDDLAHANAAYLPERLLR